MNYKLNAIYEEKDFFDNRKMVESMAYFSEERAKKAAARLKKDYNFALHIYDENGGALIFINDNPDEFSNGIVTMILQTRTNSRETPVKMSFTKAKKMIMNPDKFFAA